VQMDHFVIGLDIGSHYIKASALSTTDETFMVSALVESQGMDKNEIVDVKALGSAVKKVVQKLEVKISRNINSVFLCIQPEYLRFYDTSGHAELFGDAVTQREVDIAMDSAQTVTIGEGEEIVDMLISKYYVDDTIYGNPLGVRGSNFDFTGQLVTAPKEYIEKLYDALALAKVKISGTGTSTVGAGSILLSRSDWQKGAVLVDSGAHVTRAVLVRNHRIIDVESINLGGKNITRDLAIVLKISLLEAEELKKSYARGTLSKEENEYQMIEDIIKARVQEIMGFVEKFVRKHEETGEVRKLVVYGGGLCGFKVINKLYKSTLNLSTNFITSDIIRDDSVLTIQSSGLAYHLLSAIHCKGAIDELIRQEESQIEEVSVTTSDDDFFRKYQMKFGEENVEIKNLDSTEEDEYLDDYEDSTIFQRIRDWFVNLKNKIKK
jgi:cell division protein FtsA